MLEKLDFANY